MEDDPGSDGSGPPRKGSKNRSVNVRIPEEVYEYLQAVAWAHPIETYPSTVAGKWLIDRYRQEKHKDMEGRKDEHSSDRRRVTDRRGLTMAHGSRSKKSNDAS